MTTRDDAEHFGIVYDEAGGVLRSYLLGAPEGVKLLDAAEAGDGYAWMVLRAMNQTMLDIRTAPKSQRRQCFTCLGAMNQTTMVGRLFPERDDPSGGIAFGLCNECSADRIAAQAKVNLVLKEIMPGCRVLPTIGDAEGHA
jgi:hypothetical protein